MNPDIPAEPTARQFTTIALGLTRDQVERMRAWARGHDRTGCGDPTPWPDNASAEDLVYRVHTTHPGGLRAFLANRTGGAR